MCLFPDKECVHQGNYAYCQVDDDSYDCLMERLGELGVVIKIEEKLPSIFDSSEGCISALDYQKKLAGYVKTEPLTEGELCLKLKRK